jgi:ABC-2 type transport system permease protein
MLRAVPMTVFAMLVLPVIGLPEWQLAPPSLAAGLGFVVALAGALVLACAMSTLINVTLLWTVSGDGMVMIAATSVSFFSGLLVPLPLFPDWAQPVLEWLPYAGLADQPFRIYTGDLPISELPLVVGRQLGWTLALVAFGRWLIARGMRRLVVQGG